MFPRGPWTRSLICVSAFMVPVLLFLPVHYETNDDLGSAWILSGGDGFPADPFLMFTSRTFNGALFFLYHHAPGIPWWGIAIYATLFSGFTMLGALLFKAGKPALFFLPPLAHFSLHILVFASITSATLLLEFAALLCLFEIALLGKTPSRHPFLYLTAVGGGLGFSLLLRWEIAWYFLFFAIPLFLFADRRTVKILLAVIALSCGPLLLDRAVFHATSTHQEKEFCAYNRLRAAFHDTPDGDFRPGVTEKALGLAGWTETEYRFFRKWLVYDAPQFNRKKLAAFLAANADHGLASVPSRIVSAAFAAKRHLLTLFLAGMMLAAIYANGFANRSRKNRFAVGALMAVNSAGILFLLYYRFVARVYLPLFIFAAISPWLALRLRMPATSKEKDPEEYLLKGLAGGMIALAMVSALMLGSALIRDRRESRFVAESLTATKARLSLRILVAMDPDIGLRLERVHPLSEKILPPVTAYFPEGWAVHSPRFRRILDSLELRDGRAFLRWMLDNDSVGLVLYDPDSSHARESVALWERYYRQLFPDPPAHCLPALEYQDPKAGTFAVYRLATRTPAR